MKPLDFGEVESYIAENLGAFHKRRLERLENITFKNLVAKNPYLFLTMNCTTAAELVDVAVQAFLSSSEEKQFGDFLEGLVIFVAAMTVNGHKSSSTGVDLEFIEGGTHYVVSIKSGPNWGNSSQHEKLAQDFQRAINVLRQSRRANVESVLGICYGKTKTARHRHGYLKLVGQNFWTLISGEKEFYTDIIEPLKKESTGYGNDYNDELARVRNRLTKDILVHFCDEAGNIDWHAFVRANAGNFDLTEFGLY